MLARIPIDHDALAGFCRRHQIQRLSLFGSVLRNDFDPDRSDVDVLIDFAPGAERGLTYFKLAGMQLELADLFAREVELVLASSLDRYLRDDILASAEVHYDAA